MTGQPRSAGKTDTKRPGLLGPLLPAMVGRVELLEELNGLLATACAGRGRGVVIQAEAGMGKTTIAETLANRAADAGVNTVWGRCSAAEMPPFWPWRAILMSLAPDHLLAADVKTALSPWGLLCGGAAQRQLLFVSVIDALRRALHDAAALVVVEDIHWADGASLGLLRAVVDALPGMPLLLVVTCRDEPLEIAGPVAAFLGDLPPAVTRMHLKGLNPNEVQQLVAGMIGERLPASVAAQVHARTGGNPFFVREVTRLLASRGQAEAIVPPGVREVLERRIARLSQDCQRLVETAAIAGDHAEVALLCAVSGLPETQALALLDEAARARLLAGPATDGRVCFAHALIREVSEDLASTVRRARLHCAVAEHIERTASDLDTVAARLARHWNLAGPEASDRAALWSLRAARTARTRMGYEQAVAAYRIALRGGHADRIAILIELSEAQLYAGDLDGARQTCAQAARLAQDAGRVEDLARAALGMGTGLGGFEVRLYDEHQIALLEQALDLLPNADSGVRAAVLARLSVTYSQLGQADQQRRLARDAVTMADRVGDVPTQVAARGALCDALAGPDHVAERLDIAEQMLALAEHIDDLPAILLARRLRLVALLECGHFTAADAEIAAYTRTAERLMLPLYAWYVPIWRGMRALMCGDLPGAFRLASQAEETGLRAGSHNANLMVFTLRVAAHRARGTLADYAHEITAVLRQLPEQPMPLAAGAAMLVDAGQPDQAANLLARVIGMGLGAIPKDSEWLQAVWSVGHAAVALNNREAAAQAARHLAPYADLWVVDGVGGAVFGLVAHILGQLQAMLGHHDAAAALLGRALERHRAAGAALLVEQTQRAVTELQIIRQHHATDREAIEPAPLDGELSCQGRVWTFRWREYTATVPDSKGIRDLAVLLTRPGQPVHVLDLVEAAGGPPRRAAGGDSGPVLDNRARAAYRRRIAELAQQIAQAEQDGDLAGVTFRRQEQEFLAQELAAAYGLGGRARAMGDPVERARKAVAMRITTALRAIGQVHPVLARHLDLAVATGRFCVYRPEHPVIWHRR